MQVRRTLAIASLGLAIMVLGALATARAAAADTSKLAREGVELERRAPLRGKNKLCCGYPLVGNLEWALRYYWLAREEDFDEPDEIEGADPDELDIYTRDGLFVGAFSSKFIWNLHMEGSALLDDGRVLNYSGACRWGTGTCYQQVDVTTHPYGRGAYGRSLVPFKSIAVDPRLVPIGEPLYVPEFDGMMLPDGTFHDGCVRADDTGGGIKLRKMDFYVMTYGNFRFLLQELWGVNWVTPQIQSPRCEYLRDGILPLR
jgi:3D (Asp-Asp-Asp) domain-containing protein